MGRTTTHAARVTTVVLGEAASTTTTATEASLRRSIHGRNPSCGADGLVPLPMQNTASSTELQPLEASGPRDADAVGEPTSSVSGRPGLVGEAVSPRSGLEEAPSASIGRLA